MLAGIKKGVYMVNGILSKAIKSLNKIESNTGFNAINCSTIGDYCSRKIWYSLKNYAGSNEFVLHRMVNKAIKQAILSMLGSANLNIVAHKEMVIDERHPFIMGNPDAFLVDSNGEIKSLIDIKVTTHKNFNVLLKKNIKLWDSKYYAKLQALMGISKVYETESIVLDRDTLGFLDLKMQYDPFYYSYLIDKAKSIYEDDKEPMRVNDSITWHECKSCTYRKVCKNI